MVERHRPTAYLARICKLVLLETDSRHPQLLEHYCDGHGGVTYDEQDLLLHESVQEHVFLGLHVPTSHSRHQTLLDLLHSCAIYASFGHIHHWLGPIWIQQRPLNQWNPVHIHRPRQRVHGSSQDVCQSNLRAENLDRRQQLWRLKLHERLLKLSVLVFVHFAIPSYLHHIYELHYSRGR